MKLFFQIALTVCVQALHSGSADNTEVVASLYDTVTLRCSFPFIRGSEGLSVVWEKNGGERLIVHKYIDGQDHLEDQHKNYKGRTELSKEFSEGTVELTLRDVTISDEGPYYCRAVNTRGHGDQKVQLSINKNTEVVASLYDTVTLRCSFPFIRGSEGLSVVWGKKGGEGLIVHKYIDGQDHLEDQDIKYTGRTELSKEFSEGTVELTLRDVTFSDEGLYYCQAANNRDNGDQKVQLSINKLNADDPQVTFTYTDGKRRLKCIDIGVFRNPWVRWYDVQGKDLSELGTRTITVHEDGKRKRVESILDLDLETNTHYRCQVKEGKLKRTVRAVISDGSPVTFPETKRPE